VCNRHSGVTKTENQVDAIEKKIKRIFTEAKTGRNAICPIRDVVARINDKWTVLVILALGGYGRMRFNTLKKLIPDVSQRMLTLTLRNLEHDGFITREAFAEIPPRVEYELTNLGTSLMNQLLEFSDWANRHAGTILKNRKSSWH